MKTISFQYRHKHGQRTERFYKACARQLLYAWTKKGDNIDIRKATNEDAENISGVLAHAFIQFKPMYTRKAFEATAVSADEVLKRMVEGNVWVAIKNDRIAGTVAVFVVDGVPISNLKQFSRTNAPVWSPTNGIEKPNLIS
jgi:hypothetical protein